MSTRYEPLKRKVGGLSICVDCGSLVLNDLRLHHDAWHAWLANTNEPPYTNPAIREQLQLQRLARQAGV